MKLTWKSASHRSSIGGNGKRRPPLFQYPNLPSDSNQDDGDAASQPAASRNHSGGQPSSSSSGEKSRGCLFQSSFCLLRRLPRGRIPRTRERACSDFQIFRRIVTAR